MKRKYTQTLRVCLLGLLAQITVNNCYPLYISTDRVWEYNAISLGESIYPDPPMTQILFKFDGEKEIDGTLYNVYKLISDETKYREFTYGLPTEFYMREDENGLYLHPFAEMYNANPEVPKWWETEKGDILLYPQYKGNSTDKYRTVVTTGVNWTDDKEPVWEYSAIELNVDWGVVDHANFDVIGKLYDNGYEYADEIRMVAGIGICTGGFMPWMNFRPVPTGYSPYRMKYTLNNVYDTEGNIIYYGENKYSGAMLPDRVWEYYVEDPETDYHEIFHATFDYSDYKELEGVPYHLFKVTDRVAWNSNREQISASPASPSYCCSRYMKGGDGRVVAIDISEDWNSANQQSVLLYDFRDAVGETYEGYCYAGGIDVFDGTYTVETKNVREINFIRSRCETLKFTASKSEFTGMLTAVEGIGTTGYGTYGYPEPGIVADGIQPMKAVFNNLLDHSGNILYSGLGKNVPELLEVSYIEDLIDAQPEYFTLDGLRIAAPRSGQLLIRRQGANVKKVLIP